MQTSRLCAGALAFGAGVFVTACTTPLSQNPHMFPSEALVYPQLSGSRQSVLYRPPEGAGPFPAAVLLHTCGGIGPHIYSWAERLTKAGYVALIVDSNSPRNVRNNCQGAAAVISVDEVAADAAAALSHLRTLPFVMGDRLAVMGFSYGAMAALRLASAEYQKRLPHGVEGLRAIAFFYGTCGTDSPNAAAQRSSNNLASDIVTPTMMFLGALDTESPPRFCTTKADVLKSRGQPIAYKLYPEVTHAFDSAMWGVEGRTIYHGTRGPFLYRYSPEATEDAWRESRAFFDRHLKRAM